MEKKSINALTDGVLVPEIDGPLEEEDPAQVECSQQVVERAGVQERDRQQQLHRPADKQLRHRVCHVQRECVSTQAILRHVRYSAHKCTNHDIQVEKKKMVLLYLEQKYLQKSIRRNAATSVWIPIRTRSQYLRT